MEYKSLEKLTSNIRGVKFYTYVHMAQEIDFYGNPWEKTRRSIISVDLPAAIIRLCVTISKLGPGYSLDTFVWERLEESFWDGSIEESGSC